MKRTKGVALLFALLVVLLSGCAQKPGGSDQVAVVNGHAITQADFGTRQKIYELFFRQPMDSAANKQQLLDQMVQERLILEQADKLGATVTDARVEGEMAKFFGSLDRQYQSREQANEKLQALGLTNENIATFLRDFLLAQAVVDKQKAAVTVTDDEVRAYYEQNKQSLYTFTEDVVRAAHVLVPLDQEAKAKEIAAKARAGGDFAQLAALYSVDPGSSRLGGDLGYFARGAMVKEFADAAFGMKAGEISEPIRSTYGWHVIKVADRQGPGLLPFAKAQDDARNRLLTGKQEQAIRDWTRSLESAAKVQKNSVTGG